ncbi:hypothetical protein HBH56_239960 [Parastagonospora nodorum]|nr:hypothetical protein HBH56_239960 [Parastagonospora nodorum]KAH3955084.1 hypothetical protein HBH53_009910 [Parastagonospora nodorum]KAH3986398.1 hypothetical protein HBH52_041100 [Parastagonospora nodorum]KAH4040084.1 hypothetical protein HBI09_023460 [Parastagonospora nodorum]KAH4109736.1 hypothetical protein HBH46_024130 [Parastagonospora nodorum]
MGHPAIGVMTAILVALNFANLCVTPSRASHTSHVHSSLATICSDICTSNDYVHLPILRALGVGRLRSKSLSQTRMASIVLINPGTSPNKYCCLELVLKISNYVRLLFRYHDGFYSDAWCDCSDVL